MSDDLIRALARGSVDTLVDRMIWDELSRGHLAAPTNELRVTSQVVTVTRRVVSRTVERLVSEQAC